MIKVIVGKCMSHYYYLHYNNRLISQQDWEQSGTQVAVLETNIECLPKPIEIIFVINNNNYKL